MSHTVSSEQTPVAVAVDDIYEAMRQDGGYLDVAPDDVLAIYRLAYAHAVARLQRATPVAAAMTRTPITATVTDTVRDVARRMGEAGVSGMPVLDGRRLAGVVSVKDVLRLIGQNEQASPAALIAALLDPATCTRSGRLAGGDTLVGAIMTQPAVTVSPQTTTAEAARIMTEHGINRLPVIEGDTLCGIISRSDIVAACRTEVCP